MSQLSFLFHTDFEAPPATRNREYLKNANSGKTSRYLGVCKRASSNYYCARIDVNGQTYALGQYLTEEQAAKAYDRAAIRLLGVHAVLNFGGVV